MPMAQTVAFALIGAFILSVTYIPMMSTIALSKKIKTEPNWSDKAMVKLEMIFQRSLEFFIQIPKLTISIVVVLFILAIIIIWVFQRLIY